MKHLLSLFLLLTIAVTSSYAKDDNTAPAAILPIPEPHQVTWQQMETYAFIHFGPNTFGDREWGYGDADPKSFNPTRLDCEQWARVCKKAGMKGIILTAKHHDGFCLWPTKYTDYCVRNSPYKEGKGDVVGELAAACKKYGLKLGLYLSPWDRHQAFYGTPLYVEYFYAQLNELLTQYGDLFEVWFDGANGGDGWYGGTKEERKIDRRTYYDFPRAWKMIAEKQPNAVIFSDEGPGCRWVGNENGYAYATNWAFLRKKDVYPGYEKYYELQQGHEDGDRWVPSECDVSIRPGWFYHKREDNKVKSVDHLVDLFYRSVGHNGTMLINFPVTTEGLIHHNDSTNIVDFHKKITAELAVNLLKKASVKASDTRGKSFAASNVIDDSDSYWATNDGVTTADITFTFKTDTKVNRVKLQEYIQLGQRIKSFTVEYKSGNEWLPIKVKEEMTTIGYCRLLRFPTITTKQLRVRFLDARGPLCIKEIGAFYAPNAKDSFSQATSEIKGYDYTKAATSDANDIMLDMGEAKTVHSLHYKPSANGIISNYEIYAGETTDKMKKVASGEFSNIKNNPIMQDIYFTPIKARYVRLHATRMVSGSAADYDKLAIQ